MMPLPRFRSGRSTCSGKRFAGSTQGIAVDPASQSAVAAASCRYACPLMADPRTDIGESPVVRRLARRHNSISERPD